MEDFRLDGFRISGQLLGIQNGRLRIQFHKYAAQSLLGLRVYLGLECAGDLFQF